MVWNRNVDWSVKKQVPQNDFIENANNIEMPIYESLEIMEIFDNIQDAVALFDGEWKAAFWNKAAEELTGYTNRELVGRDIHFLVASNEKIYKDRSNDILELRKSDRADIIGQRMDLKLHHKDGSLVDVEILFSEFRIQNRSYFLGTMRDIGKRVRLYEELNMSRKLYRELADNAPVGVTCCDRKGNINYINNRMLEILGSESAEITKNINLMTFPLLINFGFSEKLLDCMENNKIYMYDTNYSSKWGKNIWLRIHIKPICSGEDTDFKISGAQIMADDITEEKQLAVERELNDRRLKLMLRGIPSPAWLMSREGIIIEQNNAAERLFDSKIGDEFQKKIVDKEKRFTSLLNEITKKEPINGELKYKGSIWETWCMDIGEDIYLFFANDITKYKNIEKELLKLSITDSLTNVYNRRYFINELEDEIERYKKGGGQFSLIMIDIDHFKRVNDNFGHSVGDMVLKKCISEGVQKRIRKIDTLARWGGEEFMILLPESTLEKAVSVADDLRNSISRLNFGEVGTVTASFGVVSFHHGDDVKSIIKKLDKMLYKAKVEGRDMVRY